MKLHKWNDVKRSATDPLREKLVHARVMSELVEANLSELRKALGLTQADAAFKAAMTQSELSRIEHREDHRVSTLRRYVEALGGELELTAVVGDKRVRLTI